MLTSHLTTAWRLPGTAANCSRIYSLRVKQGISPQRYKAGTESRCGGEWKGPSDIFFSWKIMKGMKGAYGLIVTPNVPHLDVMWISRWSFKTTSPAPIPCGA